MDLAELVATRADRVIRRWTERVRGDLHPSSMPPLELQDHLPTFLAEVAEAIRAREPPQTSETAARHGLQRLALGFSLESVVREYGVLRECILEEAAAAGVTVDVREREIVINHVITGIADAVSEYQRQRDAELQRQMSESFAFIAHELRNPLGSALTALEMMRKAGKTGDERLFGYIDRALTRMHDLIERSLRSAQAGAGITLRRERARVGDLVDDARLAASADAEAKDVELVRGATDDEEVLVDTRLLHSALTNLVRNAVKFTHTGTRVEVRARAGEGRLVVEVEDRCGGWAPGTLERAFQPFVQLGVDRSGYGLGLAIAKQAADAHGGTLRVQNLPDKGCVLVLEVPATA